MVDIDRYQPPSWHVHTLPSGWVFPSNSVFGVHAFEAANVARRFPADLFFVRLDQLAMGGGSLAHRNPLSCLVNSPNQRHSNCHPPLPTAAWHSHQKSRSSRSITRLRVAQQFDTLTDVNTKPTDAQQELLQDQLQAAVEEAVPVVGGIPVSLLPAVPFIHWHPELSHSSLISTDINVTAASYQQQLHTASTPCAHNAAPAGWSAACRKCPLMC